MNVSLHESEVNLNLNLFLGLPPNRGGMVCVLQLPLELCRLESWTPIKVTHTEQVEG